MPLRLLALNRLLLSLQVLFQWFSFSSFYLLLLYFKPLRKLYLHRPHTHQNHDQTPNLHAFLLFFIRFTLIIAIEEKELHSFLARVLSLERKCFVKKKKCWGKIKKIPQNFFIFLFLYRFVFLLIITVTAIMPSMPARTISAGGCSVGTAVGGVISRIIFSFILSWKS